MHLAQKKGKIRERICLTSASSVEPRRIVPFDLASSALLGTGRILRQAPTFAEASEGRQGYGYFRAGSAQDRCSGQAFFRSGLWPTQGKLPYLAVPADLIENWVIFLPAGFL